MNLKNSGGLLADLLHEDKNTRYAALDAIRKIACSRNMKQKSELLKALNEKSHSGLWEDRYVSMYGISRYMWHIGKIEDLKETYSNVVRLVADEEGRVRIAAFNALEHFRGFFVSFVYGGFGHFEEKAIVRLWMDSLFLLWDKVTSTEEGKLQQHLLKCVERLYRPDLEEYLTKKEREKYNAIWHKLQELNALYDEYYRGGEQR